VQAEMQTPNVHKEEALTIAIKTESDRDSPKVQELDVEMKTSPSMSRAQAPTDDKEGRRADEAQETDVPYADSVVSSTLGADTNSASRPTVTKPSHGNDTDNDKQPPLPSTEKDPIGVPQWWNQPTTGGNKPKWEALMQQDVVIPPAYKRHGVPLVYDGEEIPLTAEQEEVASMWALMLAKAQINNPTVVTNFFRQFQSVLPKDTKVQEFDKCDFTQIAEYLKNGTMAASTVPISAVEGPAAKKSVKESENMQPPQLDDNGEDEDESGSGSGSESEGESESEGGGEDEADKGQTSQGDDPSSIKSEVDTTGEGNGHDSESEFVPAPPLPSDVEIAHFPAATPPQNNTQTNTGEQKEIKQQDDSNALIHPSHTPNQAHSGAPDSLQPTVAAGQSISTPHPTLPAVVLSSHRVPSSMKLTAHESSLLLWHFQAQHHGIQPHLVGACRRHCRQMFKKHIDKLVVQIIQELHRFHLRLQERDRHKAHLHPRFVSGLKQTLKLLRVSAIKCVIVAANIEENQAAGGLDDMMDEIMDRCEEKRVPIIFALDRERLGASVGVDNRVSMVGILDYSGIGEEYKSLLAATAAAQEEWMMFQQDSLLNPKPPGWEQFEQEQQARLEAKRAQRQEARRRKDEEIARAEMEARLARLTDPRPGERKKKKKSNARANKDLQPLRALTEEELKAERRKRRRGRKKGGRGGKSQSANKATSAGAKSSGSTSSSKPQSSSKPSSSSAAATSTSSSSVSAFQLKGAGRALAAIAEAIHEEKGEKKGGKSNKGKTAAAPSNKQETQEKPSDARSNKKGGKGKSKSRK